MKMNIEKSLLVNLDSAESLLVHISNTESLLLNLGSTESLLATVQRALNYFPLKFRLRSVPFVALAEVVVAAIRGSGGGTRCL